MRTTARATNTKTKKNFAALKHLARSRLVRVRRMRGTALDLLRAEVALSRNLFHRHVVILFEVVVEPALTMAFGILFQVFVDNSPPSQRHPLRGFVVLMTLTLASSAAMTVCDHPSPHPSRYSRPAL